MELKIISRFAARREKAKERLDICKECDKYIPLTTMCGVCKCIMEGKTLLPRSECPLGKWGKYEEHKRPTMDDHSK